MYIEQMYTGCLAEAAYYIESNGEAVVIDPMRETEPYIEKAQERNAKIKYVFETHFHADFVSGHVDLARRTGAKIVYGPGAETGFDVLIAEDGQVFEIGNLRIKLLHTPGHTPESSSYLLYDDKGKERAVFTGDTLFIGEVGRPDLAVKSNLSLEQLSGMLYDSLRNKIMTLPDEVIVYPGHGAGSACGKNISDERQSTIGDQKNYNYALQEMSKEEFIKLNTSGYLPPPQYFPKNAILNKQGYEDIDEIMTRNVRPLSVDEVIQGQSSGTIILDTRSHGDFHREFIPGSINIGLDGSFAGWVGTLVTDLDQPMIIVSEPGREREAVLRLARVGYTNAKGYLDGGIEAWKKVDKPVDSIESISAGELANRYKEKAVDILDVRKPSEYESEHLEAAVNYPLDFINEHLNDLDKNKTYYIHCRSGYRSMVAASIMKANGYNSVIDIAGGMKALETTDIPKTNYVCPSTQSA